MARRTIASTEAERDQARAALSYALQRLEQMADVDDLREACEHTHDTLTVLAHKVVDGDAKAGEMAREILGLIAHSPMTDGLKIEGSAATLRVFHWGVRVLAESFKRTLGDATNYVQQTLEDCDGNSYLVTVQRATGKSPHALRREAEAERDALRAEVERLRGVR